jgi:DNA-directed RNA polymerase subunit K/omega
MQFDQPEIGKFEFVKLASLRAAQLMKGCTPRVPAARKSTTTAQREVASGKVFAAPRVTPEPASTT